MTSLEAVVRTTNNQVSKTFKENRKWWFHAQLSCHWCKDIRRCAKMLKLNGISKVLNKKPIIVIRL